MSNVALFSVRDVVSGTYGVPFASQNSSTAVRSVAMEVNNDDARSVLHTHPDDFQLYHLGSFDDESSVFSPVENGPVLICRLSTLVQSPDAISGANRAGTLEVR